MTNSPASHLPQPPVRRLVRPVVRFMQIESASGAVLLACTVLALVLANSSLAPADDAAVIAAARNVRRGEIFDRDGVRLAWNKRDKNGEPYRVYASNALAPVVGYASRQYGTTGLENAWNAQLSGVVSADPLRELTRKFRADPSDPEDLRTTLVLSLQKAAVQALGKNRGAIVMIDPRTGEVLALASTPTFDASAIADPATSTKTFDQLRADDRHPLLPRATAGLYVPGSVFKIVTSVAALGSGAINPDTTYADQPASEKTGWLIDGFRVRDGHHTATGSTALDFSQAIEVSCNIYFAETGVRTGGAALADWAARLGFGEPIPFDLGTASSQVTNGGGSFGGGFADRVELANAAYGQGETLVTPLQMALVAATIANHGELMRPHLVLAGDRQVRHYHDRPDDARARRDSGHRGPDRQRDAARGQRRPRPRVHRRGVRQGPCRCRQVRHGGT